MRRILSLALVSWMSLGLVAQAQNQIPWMKDLAKAQRRASAEKRLILLHFWDHGCPPCAALERKVFNKPEVIRALSTNYIPVKILVSENRDIARRFKIDRWPTDVFLHYNGSELHRTISSQDPRSYMHFLDKIASAARVGRPPVGELSEMHRGHQSTGQSLIGQRTSNQQATGQSQANQRPLAGNRASQFRPGGATASNAQRGNNPITETYQPRRAQTQPGYSQQVPERNEKAASQVVTNRFVNDGTPVRGNANNSRANNSRAGNTQATAGTSGSPNVGLDGFCPVKLFGSETEGARWVPGDKRFGIYHRDRLYLFCCASCLEKFKANPDQYAPMLSGYDVVAYVELGKLVPGKRAHGLSYKGHIYLFANEASLGRFVEQRAHYATAVARALSGNKSR